MAYGAPSAYWRRLRGHSGRDTLIMGPFRIYLSNGALVGANTRDRWTKALRPTRCSAIRLLADPEDVRLTGLAPGKKETAHE
jgi:hypothetical protein